MVVEHEAIQQVVGPLEVAVRREALDLARQVHQYDGVEAISEAPLLALRDGDPSVSHVLAWRGGHLAGYSQRDADGLSAELAVAPGHRRFGLAKAIVRTLAADTPRVRLWAHGDLGAARMVADSVGLIAVRELWEMTADRRGFDDQVAADAVQSPTPATAAPGGAGAQEAQFTITEFNPKTDRRGWVELNAAAFAKHPEQGKWTAWDLDRRMAESWFDPAGLLLARSSRTTDAGSAEARQEGTAVEPRRASSDTFLGYVWTKVVGSVGEIYALGVHPKAQGRRLGSELLRVALERLEAQGIRTVRLFVESDNAPAIAAYRRQGFEVTRRDIQYAFEA